MKILIVDDDAFSREILLNLLSPLGPCSMAKDGQEAVDCFTAALKSGERFDMVCLDFIMPVMDGQQARKQIRIAEQSAGLGQQEQVKIIMISSMSDLEHIMMGFDAACDAYLLKPFDTSQLFAVMAGFGFETLSP